MTQQQQQNEAKRSKSAENKTIGCDIIIKGSHILLAQGHFLLVLVNGFVRG